MGSWVGERLNGLKVSCVMRPCGGALLTCRLGQPQHGCATHSKQGCSEQQWQPQPDPQQGTRHIGGNEGRDPAKGIEQAETRGADLPR